MTDWDERARQIRVEQDAEAEKRRQELAAQERARQEAYNKLTSVAEWAIRRYREASVLPRPIVQVRQETIKPLFGQAKTRTETTKVGEVYLLRHITVLTGQDWTPKIYRLVLVTPDLKLLLADLGDHASPAQFEQSTLKSIDMAHVHELLIGNYDYDSHKRDVDQICDEIVANVTQGYGPRRRGEGLIAGARHPSGRRRSASGPTACGAFAKPRWPCSAS